MALSNAWGTALVAFQFNGTAIPAAYTGTNLYLSLHTADPGLAGTQSTSEIAYTGYARLAMVRNAAGAWTCSVKVASNTVAQLFGTMTAGAGGTATHMMIGELSTGAGAQVISGAISPTILVVNGVQPNFPIGSIVVTYT